MSSSRKNTQVESLASTKISLTIEWIQDLLIQPKWKRILELMSIALRLKIHKSTKISRRNTLTITTMPIYTTIQLQEALKASLNFIQEDQMAQNQKITWSTTPSGLWEITQMNWFTVKKISMITMIWELDGSIFKNNNLLMTINKSWSIKIMLLTIMKRINCIQCKAIKEQLSGMSWTELNMIWNFQGSFLM